MVISHSKAYTSQGIAAIAHIPGQELAKTVIVKLDGALAMAVLPASYQVDLLALKKVVGVNEAALASEREFKQHFPDCETGAMPPFGSNFYGIPVYVDETLTRDHDIAFNAGTHLELDPHGVCGLAETGEADRAGILDTTQWTVRSRAAVGFVGKDRQSESGPAVTLQIQASVEAHPMLATSRRDLLSLSPQDSFSCFPGDPRTGTSDRGGRAQSLYLNTLLRARSLPERSRRVPRW